MTTKVPASMTVEGVTAAQLAAEITARTNADTSIQSQVTTLQNQQTTRVASVAPSGTATDLSTAVPSWASRIVASLNGISLSGTSNILIQVGSGSYTVTGYVGGAAICGASPAAATQTAGLQCGILALASLSILGHAVLTHMGSNVWLMSFHGSRQTDGYGLLGSATITLAGALDRIRITSANGTDTFDGSGSAGLLID